MKRTLLFVGAGLESLPGIEKAKAMGLHVVASDINPEAVGFSVADDRFLASTYDVAATVALARDYHQRVQPLNGVICVGTDVPHTVAAVAQSLGLPGIPVETAHLAIDKMAMKNKFAADGVPVPWFEEIESAPHLQEVIARSELPLVVKPVESRGSRGVTRLIDPQNASWAYATARAFTDTGRVMVEKYLAGPQVSTESLVQDGQVHTIGFSDRNYEYLERYAPFFIENGGELPSTLAMETQLAVRSLVEKAAASLGVTSGVVKGDVVVYKGTPHMIEMAARLSGGFFCTHEIPLNTGVDFIQAAISVALGDRVPQTVLQPRFNRAVVQRYFFPEPGRIVAIKGLEQARQLPGIAELILFRRVGDRILPPRDSNASAGMVLVEGETRQQAMAHAATVMETIDIQTEPI